jgi:hypothetical protein
MTFGEYYMTPAIMAGLVSSQQEERIDHISLVIFDKLSVNSTASNILAPINIFRDVAFFKEPKIISGIPCTQENIKRVLRVYFFLLENGAIREFNIYDKTKAVYNSQTVKSITNYMIEHTQYSIYATEADSNMENFIHNIMINYCGWNKDNYDPEKWGEEKAAERRDLWGNIVDNYKQIGVGVGAAAAGAYTLNKLLPVAFGAIMAYWMAKDK